MSPRSRWIILSLALAGLGFALGSAWVHYRLVADPTYVAGCDINSTFNCSDLYRSQYGSLWGVPVALYGLFWFGLVALVAGFSTPSRHPEASHRPGGAYLFLLGTVGLASVLYLGYTAWFVLGIACLLCLGTYVCVIGIFITSGVSSPMSVSQLPGRFMNDFAKALRRPEVLALAVVLVGATGFAAAKFPRDNASGQGPAQGQTPAVSVPLPAQAVADFTKAWFEQPRVDLGIPPEGARVVVVKFNDYQCGGCGATHQWYKPVLAQFEKLNPGAVKYVVKDWPWNVKCNFTLAQASGAPVHPGSCEAAAAVRMAREISKAKELEMQDWLFANIPTVSPLTVRATAETMLGVKNFEAEYAKRLPDIQKDVADGVALRIQITPTLFINGVRIEQNMPPQYLELAIQLELKKASGK